jgi:hypothetical protein
MAKNTRWDRNLSVAPDAEGLIGHAGAVLLRKLADQCGLTSALGAALGRKGKSPLIEGDHPGAAGAGARSGHTGRHHHPPGTYEPGTTAENRHNTISN